MHQDLGLPILIVRAAAAEDCDQAAVCGGVVVSSRRFLPVTLTAYTEILFPQRALIGQSETVESILDDQRGKADQQQKDGQ